MGGDGVGSGGEIGKVGSGDVVLDQFDVAAAEFLQEGAGFFRVELRILLLDADEESIVGDPFEIVGIEQRVVEPRQLHDGQASKMNILKEMAVWFNSYQLIKKIWPWNLRLNSTTNVFTFYNVPVTWATVYSEQSPTT